MTQPEALKLYALTKISPISGQQHVMQLLMTPSQWEQIQPWIDPALPKGRFMLRSHGKTLQDILPEASPQQREFILSGTTPQEWAKLWGEPAGEKIKL
jgi:hypothetical protein